MADIIEIRNGEKVPEGLTVSDIPAAGVTQGAVDADLEHAVVVGWTRAGEFYLASSYGNVAESVCLLELAKHQLVSGILGGDDE